MRKGKPYAKRCKWKNCKTILNERNKSGKYCYIHTEAGLMEEAKIDERSELRKSKKWRQVTKWVGEKSAIMFVTRSFKKSQLKIRKRGKKNERQFAIFVKTI